MQRFISRGVAGFLSITISALLILYGLQPAYVFAANDTAADTTTVATQPVDTPPVTVDTTTVVNPPLADTNPTTPVVPATDPAPASTDTIAAPPVETQPSATTNQTGPQQPTGSSSDTYIFNPDTGMWENDYYSWDPVTKQTKPKTPVDYSFNPATGMWDTTEWIYDAPTGKYVANVITTTPAIPSLTSDTIVPEDAVLETFGATQAKALLPLLGPLSNNPSSIINTSSSNHAFDLFFNGIISNNINSDAQSGDAAVSSNTLGGSATTGDAKAVANVLNLMNSYWGLTTLNPIIFVANILGNVIGDMLINPSRIAQQSPINTNESAISNVQINSEVKGLIDNNIVLNAGSGDALVQLNTIAGDATSGNATAMANVINLMNSSIGSGQSFIGMLNIYGNLDGDVLLPSGLINSLLADNGGLAAQQVNSQQQDISADFDNTQSINNLISATAQTGKATIQDNTLAGNATSGNAKTKVTLLNLTGRQVVGKDALLVFVNVLGSWVGMIMNAPGSTAGMLGGGISQNDTLLSSVSNLDINSVNNGMIDNEISVNATSGDASLIKNTKAGNATTGDATASVNVANIIGSNFSLSDWFGILFINVFGTWHGSFGVNTDAGNPIVTPKITDPINLNIVTLSSRSPVQTANYTSSNVDQAKGVTAVSIQSANTINVPSTPANANEQIKTSLDFKFVKWFSLIVVMSILGLVLREWYIRRSSAQLV